MQPLRRAVRWLVPRTLHCSALLLAGLVGCQREEGSYRQIEVSLSDKVTVRISPARARGTEDHPCPPSLSGSALANGIAMKHLDPSTSIPSYDSDERPWCFDLLYELEAAQLPADMETLEITFDPLLQRGGEEHLPARAWHVAVDWRPEQIWTEDDLGARLRANEEFELRWEPPDEQVPELSPNLLSFGARSELSFNTTLVSSAPGSARFRFEGAEPGAVWNVTAARQRNPEVSECSGFTRCLASAHRSASLQPGGISPAVPDGVAPPRACIGAPGTTRQDYHAPHWSKFPDLSQLHVSRDASCESADLYFVLLGTCGVCGGARSTYVVGNRGTRTASFSVRSNQETVAGARLEPQQLSAPFEISFAGALSQIEILSDGDCDATSNSAWVANVTCVGPEPFSGTRGEDCNNDCDGEGVVPHEKTSGATCAPPCEQGLGASG